MSEDREEETPETVDLTAPLTDKATDSDCEELLADKVLPTADEETAPESIDTDVVEVLCPEILTAAAKVPGPEELAPELPARAVSPTTTDELPEANAAISSKPIVTLAVNNNGAIITETTSVRGSAFLFAKEQRRLLAAAKEKKF